MRLMPDTLLTTGEVGVILGKSAKTIGRMADAGKIPVAHVLPGPNGPRLFLRSDVDALLTPSPAGSAPKGTQ
jgi:hypothetical protein